MSGFSMHPHLLTNHEIQNYYQNELKFNGFCLRVKLPKIKDEGICSKSCSMQYESVVTHWIALYVNGANATYFESFEAKYIL